MVIRLNGEHEINLARTGLSDFTQVIFLSVTLPGGVRLQDLCQVADIVIPDGAEKIGACWF